MQAIRIDLSLTFTTPPSVGAGGSSGTLADKVVARNARGEFIIPASQIKGKLRHACEQILRSRDLPLCYAPRAEKMCPQIDEDDEGRTLPQINGHCLLCQIFGSPVHPSRLRFFDLVASQSELLPDETLRSMVSLNRRRRTAEEKHLFLIETAPNVNGLKFEKTKALTGYVNDPRHLHLLLVGLKALFAWGGGASRGMGWGKAEWKAWLDDEVVSKISKKAVEELCPS